MSAARLLGLLLAAGSLAAGPEELYREAAAAYEAGDFEGADAKLAAFRKANGEHPMYWAASLLWARCTARPAEAERRLREVAADAPPETRRACELELVRLFMTLERHADGERTAAAWLAANPGDEDGEEAAYWRAVALHGLGRDAEAAQAAEPVFRTGRLAQWRALAGLLAAQIAAASRAGERAAAIYRELSATSWAEAVRPAALLGLARTGTEPGEWRRSLETLVEAHPDSFEAAEARRMLGVKAAGGTRFGVQVGAYAHAANAAAQARAWRKKRRAVTIVKRRYENLGFLHLVILGPHRTRAAAEAERDVILRSGAAAQVVTF